MSVYVDILDKDGNVIGQAANDNTPSERLRLTKLEFRNRFTLAEKVGMYDSTDTVVQIFLDDIQAAEFIFVSDQQTIDGVGYLETQGLIAAGRSVDILAPILEL